MKENCWEHKKCERQPGGKKVAELGVCPAAIEKKLDNINSGKNGGRSCWVLAGTLCGGSVQGVFAHKLQSCMNCEFYKIVQTEEKSTGTLIRTPDLLSKLK
ncbi:MAG: hypothetical protein CVU05_03160 [Bacteroidetes bacterium HGW-Bacteroidetes-21]|jgi:hypothetical protein|nr:MAG: hypothetical protein CVU05_03160 [Bacteroidetes bacterium HGW-Bacteroidetes-21]